MNLERIIHMVVNMVIRRGVHEGMTRGIDALSRRGKPREKMTEAEQQQADSARATATDAQKMMRQARRILR